MRKLLLWVRSVTSFLLVGPRWAWIQSHEWAWFGGLALGGFTVASMNEFGLAVFLFILAGISALAQLWEWSGDGLSSGQAKFWKVVGTFFLALAVLAFCGIVNVYRDGKAWSQLPKAIYNARNWLRPPAAPSANTESVQETRPPINLRPPTAITFMTPGEMPLYPSKNSRLTLRMLFDENHMGNIRVANTDLYTFSGIQGVSVAALIDEYGIYSASFYIPRGEDTFAVCMGLAQQRDKAWWGIEDSMNLAKTMGFAIAKSGMSRMRVGQPTFSKHVILYTEKEMDLSQKASLQEKYRSTGLTVDFKDLSFLQQEMIDRALNDEKSAVKTWEKGLAQAK